MLTTEVLMARALTWVTDTHNLTIESLKTIPGPLKSKLQDLAISVADDMRYNQLKKNLFGNVELG